MWPFHRRPKEKEGLTGFARKLVAGIIIGGAIGSVIGKHLVQKKESELEEKDEDVKGK